MNEELREFDDIHTARNVVMNIGSDKVTEHDVTWAISVLQNAFKSGYDVVKTY